MTSMGNSVLLLSCYLTRKLMAEAPLKKNTMPFSAKATMPCSRAVGAVAGPANLAVRGDAVSVHGVHEEQGIKPRSACITARSCMRAKPPAQMDCGASYKTLPHRKWNWKGNTCLDHRKVMHAGGGPQLKVGGGVAIQPKDRHGNDARHLRSERSGHSVI